MRISSIASSLSWVTSIYCCSTKYVASAPQREATAMIKYCMLFWR